MRHKHLLVLPLAAGLTAGVTALGVAGLGAGPAAANTFETFTLTDTMGNGSHARSVAKVKLHGDEMTVTIRGTGFTPKSPHAQHFHGSFSADKNFTCPTAKADKDGDGQVTTEEGLPAYGDIVISLTTKGDTSPKSGLAVDRMPVADADGDLYYKRTIRLPEGAGAKLANLHIVQHGLDVNGNDKYDKKALGISTFAKSKGVKGVPEEATNPATCGSVSGSAGSAGGAGMAVGGDGGAGGHAAVTLAHH